MTANAFAEDVVKAEKGRNRMIILQSRSIGKRCGQCWRNISKNNKKTAGYQWLDLWFSVVFAQKWREKKKFVDKTKDQHKDR